MDTYEEIKDWMDWSFEMGIRAGKAMERAERNALLLSAAEGRITQLKSSMERIHTEGFTNEHKKEKA